MELESIHLTALALTALVILYADHMGFAYVRGKRHTLPVSFVKWSHRLVWTGFIIMVFTGFLMVFPVWRHYLGDPVFFIKLGFVLTLMINALFIRKLSALTTKQPYNELPEETQKALMVSGGLSAFCWIGAAAISFLFL